MQVIGTINRIEKTESKGSNGFESRELVVKTIEEFAQTLSIQFVQGKVIELDKFKPGQKVRIDINLKGREWINQEGKPIVFNTIQGWRIEETV